MAAIEFGSAAAAEVIKAQKDAEALSLMEEVDWEYVSNGADVFERGWDAVAELEFMGQKYRGEGSSDASESRAIDRAVDSIKEQVKRDISIGKIKRERVNTVSSDQATLFGA